MSAAPQIFQVIADGILVADVLGSANNPVGGGNPLERFIIYNSQFDNFFVYEVNGTAGAASTGQVQQVPHGPARGWPLVRRKRCDKEHEYLCKEEKKLEKQLEKPVNTALRARKAEERRASLELVKARIAALQAQMDEDDFNDLMFIDELDDLED